MSSSSSISIPSSITLDSNPLPIKSPGKGKLSRLSSILTSRKGDMTNPSSLLDAVGNHPERMKPITDAITGTYQLSLDFYRRFTGMSSSLAHIFGVDALVRKLMNIDATSMVKTAFPYLLAYATDHLYHEIMVPKDAEEGTKADAFKFAACCYILGYSMTHRITEPSRHQPIGRRLIQQAMSIWSIVHLHVACYKSGYRAADRYLFPMRSDNLITEETEDNLNLLAGIITTSVVLPKLMLVYIRAINQYKSKNDSAAGLGTQSSKVAHLPNGLTFEDNMALQIYEHCTKQLSDPSRLFQYFIVALNVLKDVDILDESQFTQAIQHLSAEKGSWKKVAKQTRNMWLLVADIITKARRDLKSRLRDISHDSTINLKEYTVIREGIELHHIYQYELAVGDLVRLKDATSTSHDRRAGTTRTKAILSGYLVQLNGPHISKKVAISLVELNGESKPVILDPPRKAKTKFECVPLDLLTVAASSAIFPGTEFLSFDNGNPAATSDSLYLQIAATPQVKQTSEERIPLSAQEIAKLKSKLIYGVLAVSGVASVALMKHPSLPIDQRQVLQFYGTEFVDKFTQVFVEAQTLIPLTADVMLDLTNRTLSEDLNHKLKEKISITNALCVADLFEYLHQKKVRIYSDKTGTVTETYMMMRDIICPASPAAENRVLIAFATTFSDQKTEAEENEIRRYYAEEKSVIIHSEPVAGKVNHLKKTISRMGENPVEFITTRVGLLTDFGGQFTIREEDGKQPVLVFCGAPKGEDNGEEKFQDTPLLRAFQEYEQRQHASDHTARQDSLTRDWCIAEAVLSPSVHAALLEALDRKAPDESKRLIQRILHGLKDHFEYLGIFQIDNPIKPGAREAIQEWNKAGIGFMMLTGDTHHAAKMIATKLFPHCNRHVYNMDELHSREDWEALDLTHSTVICTNTKPATLNLLDRLEALGDKKPNIIFCQMKDTDKKNLVVHAKKQKFFIIANGDGCNDLLMLKAAHVAIGDAARDGSFARGVEEAATFTDTQLRQLMNRPNSSLYQLLDLQAGKESKFLKHFAPLANTQPKIISSLLGKALKSVAVPRALGWATTEISGQFVKLLAYDAAFLTGVYQASITTAHSPLIDSSINRSKLPLITLGAAVVLALFQVGYCYNFQNKQVTTDSTLLFNLALSIGCLFIFLAPPGYTQRSDKRIKNGELEEKKN